MVVFRQKTKKGTNQMFSPSVIFSSAINIAELAAFAYGAMYFFTHRTPMYFKILICAVGCYAMSDVFCNLLNIFSRETHFCSGIATLGYFGCFLFMFSANYGEFDSLVDDKSPALRKYSAVALAAPLLFFGGGIVVFFRVLHVAGAWQAFIFFLPYIPASLASYFNFKHMIMPDMNFGFIKGVRRCNISALLLYAFKTASDIAYIADSTAVRGVLSALICVCLAVIAVSAKRGYVKCWA